MFYNEATLETKNGIVKDARNFTSFFFSKWHFYRFIWLSERNRCNKCGTSEWEEVKKIERDMTHFALLCILGTYSYKKLKDANMLYSVVEILSSVFYTTSLYSTSFEVLQKNSRSSRLIVYNPRKPFKLNQKHIMVVPTFFNWYCLIWVLPLQRKIICMIAPPKYLH